MVPHLLAVFQAVLQVAQIFLMKATIPWFLTKTGQVRMVQRATPNTSSRKMVRQSLDPLQKAEGLLD